LDKSFSTQPALIELLLRRDPKGCEHLCESYSAKLYGYIIRIVKKDEAAATVLDRTFKSICQNIHQYQQSKITFLSWALQLARAASIDYLYGATYSDISLVDSVKKETEALNAANILDLVHQGYKVDDVARLLNMTADEVKINIRKAMKQKSNLN